MGELATSFVSRHPRTTGTGPTIGNSGEGEDMTQTAAHETRLARVLGVPLAAGAVRQWPQSGEVVRGRDRIAEVESHFEGPRLAVGRRLTLGNTIVVERSTDYGDGRVFRNVTIAELDHVAAIRVTDYWGEPFTRRGWRELLTDALEMPSDGIWPSVDRLQGD
jgi:hypothetical protein